MCDRQIWTNRYLSALANNLGLSAEQDEDGDIEFTFQELVFWIPNHAPRDPEYLRIETGMPLSVLGDRPEGCDSLSSEQALAIQISRDAKLVKVHVRPDAVTFAVEMLAAPPNSLPSAADIAALVPRACRSLGAAMGRFHDGVTLAGIASATAAATETIDE